MVDTLSMGTDAALLTTQRAVSNAISEAKYRLVQALGALLRDAHRTCETTDAIGLQLETAVTLLKHQLQQGDEALAADYVAGWLRMAALQHPHIFADFPFSDELLAAVFEGWQTLLCPKLDDGGSRMLNRIIVKLREQLSKKNTAAIRALFIGDCLIWNVATQLQIHAQANGYDVEPTVIAKRLGVDLRNSLQSFGGDQFDLIFYSPFTFGFSDAYASTTAPRNLHRIFMNATTTLREAAKDSQKTIASIVNRFESPLYVHTVSGIRQSEPGFRGWLANSATLMHRRWASTQLNRELDAFIGALEPSLDRPILRIDESEPLAKQHDRALGQVIFSAGDLHVTGLAQELVRGPYARACYVAANLKPRKLVVCDLDNTLWQGTIGDGAVCQHVDRQTALLRLKTKGVVLAVCSKNDPANVRWDDAVLSPEDFVALEINWDRKATSIRRIAKALNLNPNCFVFLDDRPDERATATEEFPGILALDPENDETWKLIREWDLTLAWAALKDRTELYKERAARQAHLRDYQDGEEDPSEAYRKLELRVTLRKPSKKDMARVVELINRTNQFSTTTARASLTLLTTASRARHVLVAEARDKFGDMGIVGALVVTEEDQPSISHFVLSCRVFGFGIEDAMVQSTLRGFRGIQLRAPLIRTPVNRPCHGIYARNGFMEDGDDWLSGELQPWQTPDWLSIDDQFALKAQ